MHFKEGMISISNNIGQPKIHFIFASKLLKYMSNSISKNIDFFFFFYLLMNGDSLSEEPAFVSYKKVSIGFFFFGGLRKVNKCRKNKSVFERMRTIFLKK